MAGGSGAARPPTLAGLLRLLGRPDLAQGADPADPAALERAVDERFEVLVAGLVEETAASDDVHDQGSARDYLEGRLCDLEPYLTGEQVERLRAAVMERIAGW